MNTNLLNKLAPHSRVWIYQADRFFTPAEENRIREAMSEFIPGWAAHGNEIYGDFAIAESLFLVVGADEQKSAASGCSIDSLNRYVQKTGDELSINFFNRLMVAYVDSGNKINLLPMSDFKVMIKSGQVNASTMVFNNMVTDKKDFDANWRTTVSNSWHKNLLDVE